MPGKISQQPTNHYQHDNDFIKLTWVFDYYSQYGNIRPYFSKLYGKQVHHKHLNPQWNVKSNLLPKQLWCAKLKLMVHSA